MSKVFKQNVILGGQEYKAGTSEDKVVAEFKKQAIPFLIDEKKYKPATKETEIVDVKVQARITEMEAENSTLLERAEDAETALSEANSAIAGLESQLENETARANAAEHGEADVKLAESIQKLEDAEGKLADAIKRSEDAEVIIAELEKAAKPAAGKKKKAASE